MYDLRRDAFQLPLFKPEPLQARPRGTLDPAPGRYPGQRVGWAGGPALANRDPNRVNHGIAPEFANPCRDWNRVTPGETHELEYKLIIEETVQEIVPGVDTLVFAYRDAFARDASAPGMTPGPTILSDFRVPAVLRCENRLSANRVSVGHDVETSIHFHGGHLPAHADGYPDFYCLADEARDYYYPNIVPRLREGCDAPFNETWIPSTLWYHDHAMDITGFNVSRGLAGFYLMTDDLELGLIEDGVLPQVYGDFDIPLAIQDQQLNADGSIRYDFLDHNGRIGDVFTVNGRAQPFLRVERRRYRLRLLNASNARHYQVRLSNGAPMLIVGTDSWLLPRGVPRRDFLLAPGQRHNVIVDFRDAPDEVFLENILFQPDGRGPKEVDPSKERTPLVKFICEGATIPLRDDLQIDETTPLRPHVPIDENAVVKERSWRFERTNGAWAINNRLFNPRRSDASPTLGTVERWKIANHSGGWAHPIHVHQIGYNLLKRNGKAPPEELSFKSDDISLLGNSEAEVLVQPSTFTGPFVMHCHTIEHEDMRMMAAWDPQPDGEVSPLDGVSEIDPVVSGVVDECTDLEADGRILFEAVGDVDRLEDRGVGFPECEFDLDTSANQGRDDDD